MIEANCPTLEALFHSSTTQGLANIGSGSTCVDPRVNSTEIAIYAVETRAIIYILWGLLLITSASLIGVSISYVLLRIKLRSARRRETQLARHVAAKSAEIAQLEERVAALSGLEGSVKNLKAQVRHAQSARGKSDERLVEQNAELDGLRERLAEQDGELLHLRALIEHTMQGDTRAGIKAA